MGVVNVTPDSFSDGGRWLDADAAVAHGLELVAAGAAILDVGGESTRPGAAGVDPAEELRRVLPVAARLAATGGVLVSVDTAKAAVAAAVLDAGATVVNDVSAGADPEMFTAVAARGAGIVCMHMQGTPATMQDDPRYGDVVAEVGDFLAGRADAARAAGVARGAVAVDPGIGFGKTVEHNLALLGALGAIGARSAAPVVVGASRKRFLGAICERAGLPVPAPQARDDATLATTVWSATHGASVIRVHDAAGAASAVRVVEAMREVAA